MNTLLDDISGYEFEYYIDVYDMYCFSARRFDISKPLLDKLEVMRFVENLAQERGIKDYFLHGEWFNRAKNRVEGVR